LSERFRAYLHGSHRKVLELHLTPKELEAGARLLALQQTDGNNPELSLSHGDLSTNNLLVDHGFAVLDWEHIQFASTAYDVAEIWVKEFSKAPWRNQLVNKVTTMQKDVVEFQRLFRIEMLLFCLRDIILHDWILHQLHHEKRKRIVRGILRYYVATYRAALRGFTPLLRS
jgi:thiamine kinase-like enzyme